MSHLRLLMQQGAQPAQARQISHLSQSSVNDSERLPGTAMAALNGDRIVLCGGIIPTAPHIGTLWALLSADAGRHMLWLHRATSRVLDMDRRPRIEATVEEGFPQGERWLRMLGFEYEGRMPKYGADGETHLRYGLIRGSDDGAR